MIDVVCCLDCILPSSDGIYMAWMGSCLLKDRSGL
mgnify:CR=1 FL=1